MSNKEKRKAPVLRFKGFTDDWEQRKLGNIANVYDGTHTTPDYQKNGIMFLSVENIDTLTSKKFITKSDYLENYKHKPEYHDIFMTRIGSIGKTNILETHDPRAFYVSLALIKPKDIDPYYLKYWLSSNTTQKEIWRRTLQIAFPQKINKDEISKVQSSISKSKNEQYNIGQLLNKIDHLLLLQQRKLNKLKSLRKGIKESTLPKNLKSPSASFENTGKIFRFSDLFKRSSEKNDGSFSKDKVISVANMRWGTAPKNSSDDYMKTYFILRKGDIAFEGNRSKNYSFGRFVANDLEDGIVSHVFIVYRPKKELNLNYLKYYINDEQVMRTPLRMSTSRTTMMTNLVQKDIVKQKLLLPSIQEQNKLGELYKKVDALIQMNQLKLNRLNQLKQFLLQKLFV